MSAILTPLWLEDVDGDVWVVCAPFRFRSDLLGETVEVKTGTDTDLATIPWLFRIWIPKSGKHNKGAVLHDAGLTGKLWVNDQPYPLTKDLADALFLEAMLVSKVHPRLAALMHWSVSTFGRRT